MFSLAELFVDTRSPAFPALDRAGRGAKEEFRPAPGPIGRCVIDICMVRESDLGFQKNDVCMFK